MKDKGFLAVYLIIGIIWLRSSIGKITGGEFVNSLGGILSKIVKGNPYPWYKNFLDNVAIPNSQIFATLTMWGEFLTAILITAGSIYLIFSKNQNKLGDAFLAVGLIGGMFLNAIFWLGFGYTSPATDSLNLLMFFIELIGIVVVFKYLTTSSK